MGVCLLAGAPARADNAPALANLLERVGRQVEKLWEYLPGVTCVEQASQTKLNAKGKVLYSQRASYDYLILLQSSGGRISVDESRVQKGRSETKGKASLLLTSGFSLLPLIFHPIYQSSYEFALLPDEPLGGRPMHRIEFKQIANTRSPSVLLVHQREYPVEWKGVAWVDPTSSAIVKIQTGLSGSMQDMGLLQLSAEVNYDSVKFSGEKSSYWLPTRAVVEALTRRQHWRNTHLFTDYRRFSVETEVHTAAPQ